MLVMERMRRRRRPVESAWMFGWQSTFFHVVEDGTSWRLMGELAGWGVWGVIGVQ